MLSDRWQPQIVTSHLVALTTSAEYGSEELTFADNLESTIIWGLNYPGKHFQPLEVWGVLGTRRTTKFLIGHHFRSAKD